MSSKIRKQKSGYEKRKKKQRIDEFIQSQKGAIDRFIVKPSDNTPLNETPNFDVNIDSQTPIGEEDIIGESSENNIDDVQSDSTNDDNHVLSDRETEKETDYVKKFGFDIFDPRNWDALDSKMVDFIVEEGLRRDMTIDKGPRDELLVKLEIFFGTVQRIYTIFANSNKRWKILEDNVKKFTLKPLSVTRWESRIESVKAIRFQVRDIREALLDLAEKDNDSKVRSKAKSLALNELGDFEFLVSMVVWYEMLYHVNLVSTHLQSKSMLIDIAIKEMKGLITFFEDYREIGLVNAIEEAKRIAFELNISPVFPQRRVIRRKRQFDENQHDESEVINQSPEESFRVNYFLFIVDQAINSLKWRFEKYQDFENVFGFLFTSERLLSMDDGRLEVCCNGLEDALKKDEQFDIVGNELYMELKFLRGLLPKEKLGPFDMLGFLKHFSCFPNVVIAYRIMLTIPVTVASAERSFSKLKLLKSYLRSTMTQERLNGLALIAIENEILEQIEYKDLINEFASQNARRSNIFKKKQDK